jgi:hypothetical protein
VSTHCVPGPETTLDDRVVRLVDLAVDATLVPASTPVAEIDRLFRDERGLRSLVVQNERGYSLLTREQVEYTLTGRLGFGRGLHSRSTAGHMAAGNSFSLPGRLELAHAAQQILELPEESRYRDVLVLTEAGPGVVPRSWPVWPCSSSTWTASRR